MWIQPLLGVAITLVLLGSLLERARPSSGTRGYRHAPDVLGEGDGRHHHQGRVHQSRQPAVAYIMEHGDGFSVLVSGVTGKEYDRVLGDKILFSLDGKRWA